MPESLGSKHPSKSAYGIELIPGEGSLARDREVLGRLRDGYCAL